MAKPKKEGGPVQQLSSTGRKRKHDRDVCYAKGWVWNKDTGVCSKNAVLGSCGCGLHHEFPCDSMVVLGKVAGVLDANIVVN